MKICYFGIYNPEFSRNKIYMSGLRSLGVEIFECRDDSSGILKYVRLWKKHRMIKNSYDALIVGYPGHIVTPLARFISSKPVILDALCSLYEADVISRKLFSKYNPRAWIKWVIDWSAFFSAHKVLVETNAQGDYLSKFYCISRKKFVRVFTGVDESVFYPDVKIGKRKNFTVVFRGKFLPEAGVHYIISTAKMLEEQGIDFLIIGNGYQQESIEKQIIDLDLKNLEWERGDLSFEELRNQMLKCHLSLGQFENNPRLSRTIPHKAFESLALGLPYLTAKAEGISELLTDQENCFMVPCGDSQALASKILYLKENPKLLEKISENGKKLFQERFGFSRLSREIYDLIISQK